MTIRVEVDSLKITVDTEAELATVFRAARLARDEAPNRKPGRPLGSGKKVRTAEKEMLKKKKKTALAFLKTVKAVGGGVSPEDLMIALKLPHTRAIGSRSLLVRNFLKSLGFKPEAVFISKKKVNEPRRWLPKPKIDEAIEAVEQLGDDA